MLSSSILNLQRKRVIELQISSARLKKEIENLETQQGNFKQDFELARAEFEDEKFILIKEQDETRKRLIDTQRNSITAQQVTNAVVRKKEDFQASLERETASRTPDLEAIASANKNLNLSIEEEKVAKAQEEAIWQEMLLLGAKMNQCAEEILLLEEKIKDLEEDSQNKLNDFEELITRLQVLAESQEAEIISIEKEIEERQQKGTGPQL